MSEGSVLDALISLESDKLAKYCQNIQVDGVIAQTLSLTLDRGFGGEGMFMTEMTGPGWVMLQSLKKLPPSQQGLV